MAATLTKQSNGADPGVGPAGERRCHKTSMCIWTHARLQSAAPYEVDR